MYCVVPGVTLILASGSPRRKELLAECGIAYEVVVSDVDETVRPGESPQQLVERLSWEKASKVGENRAECWILGADTDVVLGSEIFGKPSDHADAVRMLGRLQGRTHEVWGGITLLHPAKGIRRTVLSCTLVAMAKLTTAEIEAYVATGVPLDKAGAYGIQGLGAHLIESLNGSYTNVVGLNLALALSMLQREGVVAIGGKQ